jgi:hypothetical protein
MGIWIELGIFVLVLAFGMWQIHDVGLERRKSAARKEAAKAQPAPGRSAEAEKN